MSAAISGGSNFSVLVRGGVAGRQEVRHAPLPGLQFLCRRRLALRPEQTAIVVAANGLTVGDVTTIGGTLSGITGSTVNLTAGNGTLTVGNSAALKDIDATGAVSLLAAAVQVREY